jgi:hypothetical protein
MMSAANVMVMVWQMVLVTARAMSRMNAVCAAVITAPVKIVPVFQMVMQLKMNVVYAKVTDLPVLLEMACLVWP